MLFVLIEVKTGYQSGDLWGEVNHLLFMDDLKSYGQNQKLINTLINRVRIFSEDKWFLG